MRRRALVAGVLTIAAIAPAAGPAQAGTYNVVACGDAPASANNTWVAHNNDVGPGQLETGNGCGGSGTYAGLYARDALTCSNVCPFPPNNAAAGWTFSAPSGTLITGLSYSRWLYKMDDDNWRPALTADGSVVSGETCSIVYPAFDCNVGAQGGQPVSLAIANASTLGVGVLCRPNPTNNCGNGGTLHHIAAVLYGATVTLSDSSAPSLSGIGGPLLAGGYQKGSQFASFNASDNAGIRGGRLYVDGSHAAGSTYSCDFTFAVPCQNKAGAELVLDTRSLTDGTHSVQVAALDPALNETKSTAQTITVDNGAPTPPEGLAVDGGNGWHASNSFAVSWSNPGGQVAPVAIAHYEVCASGGSSCQPEQQVAAPHVSHIDGISVPSTGEWQLRVWLEDAAANVESTQVATATLRYGSPPVTTTPETTSEPIPDTAVATTPDKSTTTTSQPPSSQTTPVRRDPSLRLSSARLGHGRIVVRGRLARGARVRLSLTLRLSGAGVLRRTVVVPGGRFTFGIRVSGVRRLRGIVLARIVGDPEFRPQRATLRLPDTRTRSR